MTVPASHDAIDLLALAGGVSRVGGTRRDGDASRNGLANEPLGKALDVLNERPLVLPSPLDIQRVCHGGSRHSLRQGTQEILIRRQGPAGRASAFERSQGKIPRVEAQTAGFFAVAAPGVAVAAHALRFIERSPSLQGLRGRFLSLDLLRVDDGKSDEGQYGADRGAPGKSAEHG